MVGSALRALRRIIPTSRCWSAVSMMPRMVRRWRVMRTPRASNSAWRRPGASVWGIDVVAERVPPCGSGVKGQLQRRRRLVGRGPGGDSVVPQLRNVVFKLFHQLGDDLFFRDTPDGDAVAVDDAVAAATGDARSE